MTRAVLAIALAGCAFTPGKSDVPGGSNAMIVDDDVPTFSAGTLDGLTVDALGVLAPDAFALGGLHARGFIAKLVTATTTYAELTPQVLGTVAGERYGELPVTDWQTNRPYGLGITGSNTDNFTVVYDGEIYLAAGPTTLQLVADDFGFVEIDLGAITPAIHSATNANPIPEITITPPSAGWYPIHGAMCDGSGDASMMLSTVSNGVATPITPDQLRAEVTSAAGAVVVGSADRVFSTLEPGSSIEPSLAAQTFTNISPYDLENIGSTDYSLRFGGQLRVDTAESYTFALDVGTDMGDYARLLVDGTVVAGQWPGGIAQLTSTALPLSPGWHDLVLDYAQDLGTAKLGLTMATPSFPAAPIPSTRMRPVRTGGLLASAVGANTQVVDATASGPSVTPTPITVTMPSGAILDFVDFLFIASGAGRPDLSVTLSEGATIDAPVMPPMPAYEDLWDYWPGRSAFAGVAITGPTAPFVAMFTDSVMNGQSPDIQIPTVIASYHGGPNPPFAQAMVYVSAMHATPGATSIDAITVTADLQGATLLIEVNTGAGWVTVANGAAPMVDASPADTIDALQYRLTIKSDGWAYPTIDKVEIDYTGPAP